MCECACVCTCSRTLFPYRLVTAARSLRDVYFIINSLTVCSSPSGVPRSRSSYTVVALVSRGTRTRKHLYTVRRPASQEESGGPRDGGVSAGDEFRWERARGSVRFLEGYGCSGGSAYRTDAGES